MDTKSGQFSLDLDSQSEKDNIAKLEAQREQVLLSVNSATLDTIQQRVAWILNHYPEARDSDISLQIRYWDHFEPDFNGEWVTIEDMYRFARLPSLRRARAKIQNEFRLFLVSPKVQQHRGKLDDSEKARVV